MTGFRNFSYRTNLFDRLKKDNTYNAGQLNNGLLPTNQFIFWGLFMFRVGQFSHFSFPKTSFRFCSGGIFPLKTTDFCKIRKETQFFVDKSNFIPKLEQAGKHTIISRPNGWGKSLLLSTLKYYYDKKEESNFTKLFDNLEIHKNPTNEKNKYHVLSINFSDQTTSFHETINNHLKYFIEKYNIHFELNTNDCFSNLQNIANILNVKGEKMMILMDEFDHFDSVLDKKSNKHEKKPHIYSLYETIKQIDLNQSNIRTFATIKSNLKSDFITNLSHNKEFGNLFGFTRNDMNHEFDKLNIPNEDKNKILKIVTDYRYPFYGSSENLYEPLQCLLLFDKFINEPDIRKLFKETPESNQAELLEKIRKLFPEVDIDKNIAQTFKYYHTLATEDNFAVAQYQVGCMFNNGLGVDEDLNQAFKFYKLAADQGHVESQFNVGNFYFIGKGGAEKDVSQDNLSQAFKYFKLAADQNFADAQYKIGLIFNYGIGVTRDISQTFEYEDLNQAFKYYKLAADKGHAKSQLKIGNFYEKGLGEAEKDVSQAFKYRKLAADQNLADAQFKIGSMFEHGRGVEKDVSQAFKYYKLAADQGHVESQFNIGNIYGTGERGAEKDVSQTFKYFKLAADQGHAKSQFNIGCFYETGTGGVEKDSSQAFKYFKLAADQGHVGAQFNIGLFYERGTGGVDKDFSQSCKYYKAAAQNFIYAQHKVGMIFKDGIGVAKDISQTFAYYKPAADQGHAESQFNIGWFYEKGTGGVDKDLSQAFKYFKLAADQNFADAQHKVGLLFAQGLGVEKDVSQTFKYFKLAADQGHVGAQFNIGCFYERGTGGVDKDLSQAFKYFKLAADQNFTDAQHQVGLIFEKGRGVEKDLLQSFQYCASLRTLPV